MANFLANLALCKEYVIDDGYYLDTASNTKIPYDNSIKSRLLELIDYVRRCSWSNTATTKFIAKYYDVAQHELPELWRQTYPDAKEKSPSALRTQVQHVCKWLDSVFPYDVVDAYINRNMELVNKIHDVVDVMTFADTRVEGIIGSELTNYLIALPSTYHKFEPKECRSELFIMALMSKYYFEECLGFCNKKKLAFVFDTLSRQSSRKGIINKERIDMLREFTDIIEYLPNDIEKLKEILGVIVSNGEKLDSVGVSVDEGIEAELGDMKIPLSASHIKALRGYIGEISASSEDFLNPDIIKLFARSDVRFFVEQLKQFSPSEVAFALEALENGDDFAKSVYNKALEDASNDSIIGQFSFLPSVVTQVKDVTEDVSDDELYGARVSANTLSFLNDYTEDTFRERLGGIPAEELALAMKELNDELSQTSDSFVQFLDVDRSEIDADTAQRKVEMSGIDY